MRVGVLGGGQLGRMLALAGRPLGLRFRFLEPKADPPVAELGEVIQAEYDDERAIERFVRGLDVVTFEFENVSPQAAGALGEVPLRPPLRALEVARDRLFEKRAFAAAGVPTVDVRAVDSLDDLHGAVEALGLPLVLKTRRFGYDGKGQRVLRRREDAQTAWTALGRAPLLAEAFCAFERELSVLGVRGVTGESAFYPLVENVHRDGILRRSMAPASVAPDLQERAATYARALMQRLDYVGVMALELFDDGGELLANEMAPRVHNSGHWTLDGALCSQFENHLRAVCGFPLGATGVYGPNVMINLIEDVPPREALLSVPGARLHLYEKRPRPGRKLGHVTVCGPDLDDVLAAARRIEELATAPARDPSASPAAPLPRTASPG